MNRFGNNLVSNGSNKAIIEIFHKNDVEYLLIGGLAISWYCQEREANDMDLLVNCTPENSKSVAISLHQLKLNGFNENSFSKRNLQVKLKTIHYADLLTEINDELSYRNLLKNSINAHFFDFPIKIPSVENLIKLKQYSIDRQQQLIEKDKSDIRLLRKSFSLQEE